MFFPKSQRCRFFAEKLLPERDFAQFCASGKCPNRDFGDFGFRASARKVILLNLARWANARIEILLSFGFGQCPKRDFVEFGVSGNARSEILVILALGKMPDA